MLRCLQNATRKREDIGVELYGQQHALAKAQMAYDQSTQELAELASVRSATELRLSTHRQHLQASEAPLNNTRQQVWQSRRCLT